MRLQSSRTNKSASGAGSVYPTNSLIGDHVPVKRETGASPVRTRHCKQGVFSKRPLGDREGAGRCGSASQETCLSEDTRSFVHVSLFADRCDCMSFGPRVLGCVENRDALFSVPGLCPGFLFVFYCIMRNLLCL